ncbi:hypothetical protein V6N13_034895 [Hibiscus sabdariffa]|uniref:Uncharacterized protein n=1 Tax=Hibiscus sabdariffa TaxID=183260 RepID=A0ABR2AXU7_9ROSI
MREYNPEQEQDTRLIVSSPSGVLHELLLCFLRPVKALFPLAIDMELEPRKALRRRFHSSPLGLFGAFLSYLFRCLVVLEQEGISVA